MIHVSVNSPVIIGFSAICAGMMLLDNIVGGRLKMYLASPDRNSPGIVEFVFRLFSHTVIHFNWQHLIGNLSIILLVGPLLEAWYGSYLLLELMALVAIGTGLLRSLFPVVPVIGASGIGFALIITSSFVNVRQGEIPITLLMVSALFLGREIVGLIRNDNISHFTHLLGGVIAISWCYLRF